MSGLIRFGPGERAAIDAAHEAGRAAAAGLGLALPARGAIHARFNRELIRRARRACGSRPRHVEVSANLLDWSRTLGRVELFALCPLAFVLVETHGEPGLAAAEAALPALGEARRLWEEAHPFEATPHSAGARAAAGSGAGPAVASPEGMLAPVPVFPEPGARVEGAVPA